MEIFPGVPTAKEQGVPFALGQWRGLAAVKGTDPAKIKVVHDAFKQAMADPEFLKLAQQAGILLDYKGTADFAEFVKVQDKLYEDIVKTNKLGDRYK